MSNHMSNPLETTFRCTVCGHNRYEVDEVKNKAGFSEPVRRCTRCKTPQPVKG